MDLKDLILSDPYNIGTPALVSIAEGGTSVNGTQDSDLLNLLNTPNPSVARQPSEPVPRWKIKSYLLQQNLIGVLLADNIHTSAQLFKVFYQDVDLQLIDMSDPGFQYMVGALKADGLITDDNIAFLTLLGSKPGTPAEAKFGPGTVVQLSDISFVLRGVR